MSVTSKVLATAGLFIAVTAGAYYASGVKIMTADEADFYTQKRAAVCDAAAEARFAKQPDEKLNQVADKADDQSFMGLMANQEFQIQVAAQANLRMPEECTPKKVWKVADTAIVLGYK